MYCPPLQYGLNAAEVMGCHFQDQVIKRLRLLPPCSLTLPCTACPGRQPPVGRQPQECAGAVIAKCLGLGGLKWKHIFPRFKRLDVQDEGVGRLGSFRGVSPWLAGAISSLRAHRVFPLCKCTPGVALYAPVSSSHKNILKRAHPNSFLLTKSLL